MKQMSNYDKAQEVLIRSREEVLRELVRAGESGGTGLAQRYAPIFANLQNAIEAIDRIKTSKGKTTNEIPFAEKMKAAKAAKKAALVAA